MSQVGFRYVYGPVPSRRLGRSLGIDLVPFKTCTYDCVYCQLGRTTNKTTERKEYAAVDEILAEMERTLAVTPAPDFISFAGSGEPTLNARIGDLILEIKKLTRIPVAVLTNGSLLWMPEVREALMNADVILPSLDAGDEHLFQCVNRPHEDIAFDKMIDGLAEFTERFPGSVWLEIFLLAGVTGIPAEIEKLAALARRIRPNRVQLNTVSRPPAEEFACAISGEQMEHFRKLFSETAEVIIEIEQGELPHSSAGGATDTGILSLLSRRSCTVRGVSSGLGLHPEEVSKRLHVLSKQGAVVSVRRDGVIFYETVRNK